MPKDTKGNQVKNVVGYVIVNGDTCEVESKILFNKGTVDDELTRHKDCLLCALVEVDEG